MSQTFPAPASNYPSGFNNITLRGIPITQVQPGQVYWVSNSALSILPGHINGSDGNNGSFSAPFSTIQKGIDSCVAGRGDIVFVKPGHAETITSATTLLFNKAGVAIVGLGQGTSAPTLTYTTANTATIPVSADNISIVGFRFVGNFLSIASAITVAAAKYFTVEYCDVSDTDATHNFLSFITTTVSTNSDYLWAETNNIVTIGTTNNAAAFVVLNTMTGLTLVENRVTNTLDRANVSNFLSHAALVLINAVVARNTLFSANSTNTSVGMLISTTATTGSGMAYDNYIRALDVAAAIIVNAVAIQWGMFNNLYIGDGASLSGFVLPAIGSDA